MHERAGEHDTRACGQRKSDRMLRRRTAPPPSGPVVASWNQLRRTILAREFIHGDDGRERDHRPWPRNRVERVVEVKGLLLLAGVDADRLARGKKTVRKQETVAEREHPLVERDLPEHLAARDQGVDALGVLPFERVAPPMRAEVEGEHAAHLAASRSIQEIRNDGVAVALDGRLVRFEVETHQAGAARRRTAGQAASFRYIDSISSRYFSFTSFLFSFMVGVSSSSSGESFCSIRRNFFTCSTRAKALFTLSSSAWISSWISGLRHRLAKFEIGIAWSCA